MRVGITLPQFRHDPEPALAVARRAERAGLDGVFVFDHLWPLGQPERPALHGLTLLGALAAETGHVTLGTLVARVGMVPDAVLVNALVTAQRISGGRVVAGLGVGDSASRPELEAAGIPYPPAAERRTQLGECCRRAGEAGLPTWVGGRSAAIRRVAAQAADGWNAWGAPVAEIASAGAEVRAAARSPAFTVSWGGQVLVGATPQEAAAKRSRHGDRPGLVWGTVEDLADHLVRLAAAGAGWAVCAPLDVGADPAVADLVAEAATRVRGGSPPARRQNPSS